MRDQVNAFGSPATYQDLLCRQPMIAGNFFPYRVQLGQDDASLGLLLKGTPGKEFRAVDPSESGCYVGGDVRSMVSLKDKSNHTLLIFAKNDDAPQVLKLDQ